ncbi:ABC-2 type transport system ATP-binding protein [Paenibacillus phyllosphaerae]|uniref:ABC-2 type transport system ATP-binding protein n=1 Tax=Paenibacillus phyllosphaerae TaxID=274593 RepID=A0A7W5AX49_9BACL|nr:ABC transporter ATP-binding protein [Paenibacillus phyllosphaerae]MBB3110430.1 ABC-2 type transport system ATP-binding protein [Paenibacillus phyllosphaerae]
MNIASEPALLDSLASTGHNRNTPSEIVLDVKGIQKKIRGKTIIHDVSFHVRAGEIFGFLGPNGSGKTTTIRMLVNLIKPSAGEIRICGYNVERQQEEALRFVGCIVENPEVYSYMTGWENLEHFARMQEGIDEARIHEVVDIVSLGERIHDKVKTYSLGMRQRLGIAQALLGRPKLLILDEPTNGLDPKGIKELRAFIRMLAGQGMSLFISSHLLSEIQLMCDRVAIISHGRVLAVGPVDELVNQAGSYVVWQFDEPDAGRALLADEREVQFVAESEHRIEESILANMDRPVITSMAAERIPEFVEKAVRSGIGIRSVQQIAPTLEELFLSMTEGEAIG